MSDSEPMSLFADLARPAWSGGGFGNERPVAGETDVWLTPPWVLAPLGRFDLDPCGHPEADTATNRIVLPDDGLAYEWNGRVWLNPPYSDAGTWVERLAEHGTGTALVFARTDVAWWHDHVFGRATGVLFIRRRIAFLRPGRTTGTGSAGAPSALIAYGPRDASALAKADLDGAYIELPVS